MKCSLGISNFLEVIPSLSHSVVFLYFFALITEEGFLSLLAILWNFAFRCLYLSFSPLLFTSLLFTAICMASQTAILLFYISFSWGGLPWWLRQQSVCLQCRRPGFNPWRRKWQPIPVFLPGKFHEQRNLGGYSPWGCKELDMTERLNTAEHILFIRDGCDLRYKL